MKAGVKESFEVKPYATFELTGIGTSGSATINGAAYDPDSGRLFVTEAYGESPEVHVFDIDVSK